MPVRTTVLLVHGGFIRRWKRIWPAITLANVRRRKARASSIAPRPKRSKSNAISGWMNGLAANITPTISSCTCTNVDRSGNRQAAGRRRVRLRRHDPCQGRRQDHGAPRSRLSGCLSPGKEAAGRREQGRRRGALRGRRGRPRPARRAQLASAGDHQYHQCRIARHGRRGLSERATRRADLRR